MSQFAPQSTIPTTAAPTLPPASTVVQSLRDRGRALRMAQERDLVARLLQDDPAAWRTFTSEFSRVIVGSIRRVLTRFSKVTSDHDVDEVYARFCFELLANDRRKLRRFDPEKGGNLGTWVGLLATNATYDYLRRIKRDRGCEPLPESDNIAGHSESPYDRMVLQQRAALTTQTLHSLSERDRQFVELYFGQGMDAEQVARKMNISIKTVYTKRHKITARLEALVAEQR